MLINKFRPSSLASTVLTAVELNLRDELQNLQLRPELRLRDALAHGRGRRDAAGDGLEQVVGVVGAGPLGCVSAE